MASTAGRSSPAGGGCLLAHELDDAPVGTAFGVSKSAADRIIDHIAPMLALQPVRRRRKDAVLIVEGTLVPTRDRQVAASSKNYRFSTITRSLSTPTPAWSPLIGRPLPGNRNDCKAWEESGAKDAVGHAMVVADGGYIGTRLLIPHRREAGQELPAWKEEHNASHRRVRARVEHVFARMKNWKILRDCRLKGHGVHRAILGVAHLHNLVLAG